MIYERIRSQVHAASCSRARVKQLLWAVALSIAAANAACARGDQRASPDADAFVSWAQSRAVPLHDFPSDENAAAAVERFVGTAQVVALGEPAHGAHEPLAFRNDLLAYLVEQLGFTAIAIESGLSESRHAGRFVLGGPGTAEQVARATLTWGFGDYAENVALLEWIRRYNQNPTHSRKVKFYGFDLTGGSPEGRFASARIALDDAISYLARFAPERSARERDMLEPFLDRFTHEEYWRLQGSERERLREAIEASIAFFEKQRCALLATSSEEDYEWAKRNAVVARQIEEMFRLWPADVSGAGVSPEFYRAAAARDRAMADNVQWVLQREGPSGRVLVFAHNAHVMNAALRGGLWNVYPQAPAAMGQHLKAAAGERARIIGFSSAINGSGLPNGGAPAGSLDQALSRVGQPRFLLDLREARGLPWLSEARSLRANFTTEIEIRVPEAFDALVFMERLTPARSRSTH